MEITVKAHGIEATMSIVNYPEHMQIILSNSGITYKQRISYSEMATSYMPILHQRIYNSIKKLADEVRDKTS